MGIIERFIDKRVQTKLSPIVKELQQKAYSFSALQFSRIGSAYWNLSIDPTTSDTLFTILDKRTKKESSIPIYAYKVKDQQAAKQYFKFNKASNNPVNLKAMSYRVKAMEEVTADNELSKLLQRPSFTVGADSFWQGVYWSYALREAFIWKNRGGIENGKPIELVLLHGDFVEVVPDQSGLGIKEYKYNSGTNTITIPKKDMIHWKNFNPAKGSTQDDLRGFPVLTPLKKRLSQDESLTDQAIWGAANHGADGVLFPETIENYSETQKSQLKEMVDDKANNAKTRKSIGFLPSKFGYINFGRATDEMQILEQLGWTFERVCHLFGVPPEAFTSDSNFSNKEWAQKNWITNNIMFTVNSLRDELNRSLVPDFGGGLICDSDFTSLPEMQDDMKKLLDGLTPLFDRGGLNQDEMREMAGFEPTGLPEHQKFYIQSGYTPMEDFNLPADTTQGKDYGDYGS